MARAIRIIQLRDGDRSELERLVRTRTTEQRVVERARIVLCSADGLKNAEICEAVGVFHPTVTRWLDRYEELGVAGLLEAAQSKSGLVPRLRCCSRAYARSWSRRISSRSVRTN